MEQFNQIYSDQRTGIASQKKYPGPRTQYQMDYDRLIFSSAFRRLQNKTQVFPLPGSVFVHNRLTHSLEVASVGRSLGYLIGHYISTEYKNSLNRESLDFYKNDLNNVISAACLCHDIGNPAFGHSGEDAIANYFVKNESDLKPYYSDSEWSDFINFEGNANAIRVLTQHQNGKNAGGLLLTYSTLSAIAKYPCESLGINKNITHRKKFGFFQSEKETFKEMANATGMIQEKGEETVYKRHPFVWITEVADDICYNIVDLEDAHRLGIIEHRECEEYLMQLIGDLSESNRFERFKQRYAAVTDKNAKISYLRATAIGLLIDKAATLYNSNIESIVKGEFETPLFVLIHNESDTLNKISEFSVKNIYNHRKVVEIENAGYNVMFELLNHFIPPILKEKDQRRKSDKKALKLLPDAFTYENESVYLRTLGVLDYISGMTDNYAIDLYRRIKGIEIGMKF